MCYQINLINPQGKGLVPVTPKHIPQISSEMSAVDIVNNVFIRQS